MRWMTRRRRDSLLTSAMMTAMLTRTTPSGRLAPGAAAAVVAAVDACRSALFQVNSFEEPVLIVPVRGRGGDQAGTPDQCLNVSHLQETP